MALIDKGGEGQRVRITYEVTLPDMARILELPFVVGILADLSGKPSEPLPELRERKFVAIDQDNFNGVIRSSRPRLSFVVDNKLTGGVGQIAVDLSFDGDGGLEQFGPAAVAERIEPLRKLVAIRQQLNALQTRMDGNDALKEWLDKTLHDSELRAAIVSEARRLFPDDFNAAGIASDDRADAPTLAASAEPSRLDQVINEGRIGWDDWEREAARREIATVVVGFVDGTIPASQDSAAAISLRISEIDSLLSQQLNATLHHPDFQRLEATWRGLHYLVNQTDLNSLIRFRVMNVSKEETRLDIEKPFQKVHEDAYGDTSELFRKLYENEYGVFGGEPYAVLVGNYFFDRVQEENGFLERLSKLAEVAHLLFIAGAGPGLFGLDDYTELARPRDLAKIFQTPDYSRWRDWRSTPPARHVGLVLPRMLLRKPYTPDDMPGGTFSFTEDVDENHGNYLWGNAVYAFASRLTRAFERDGWCAAIRGYETGGLVSGLPNHIVQSEAGDVVMIGPTEATISDRRCRELAELGFIALCHEKHADRAVFFSTPSCARPARHDGEQAMTLAQFGVRLEYVMVMARFAHYFKIMERDRVGDCGSAEDRKTFYNQWIAQYVREALPSEGYDVRFPLRSARVEVAQLPGGSERYQLRAYLQPWFRLRVPGEPLELTVDLA